jgi:hypothetical protein
MVFDVPQWKILRTEWKPDFTRALLKRFKRGDLETINDYLRVFFDRHARREIERVCVPLNCPDPWPPPLAPIWLACDHDKTTGALLLGNLYCRYAIKRPEWFWCAPLPFTKRETERGVIGPARSYHISPDPRRQQ